MALTLDAQTSGTMSETYDTNGRMRAVTYPSGFSVQYSYTALGYLHQVTNGATAAMLWQANAMDAEMHLTQSMHGNNVMTSQTFDPPTGRLTGTAAWSANGSQGAPDVQNVSYSWDPLGNLTSRTDAISNLAENFEYDPLNRLISAEIVDGPAAKSYSYDTVGNITNKSDVGDYTYGGPGAGPHAVTSITGTVNGVTNPTFTYDADGNLVSGAGRTLSWMSFNMVTTIQNGTSLVAFTYDSEHSRIKQSANEGMTYYFNDPASGMRVEQFQGTGGGSQWNDYIYAGGAMVAVYYEVTPANQQKGQEQTEVIGGGGSPTTMTRYFHKDHLGSIAAITDETGAVVERNSYDPFGKRRFANGADDPGDTITSLTSHGFTGQEQIADVQLVNLNGRIYDPQLGRMMSADPFVQDVLNMQSLNRYTYVINNPLCLTDPSGYFSFGSIFHAIVHVVQAIESVDPVAQVINRSATLREVTQTAAIAVAGFYGGPGAAAGAAAFFTAVNGGSLGDTIKAGALTYVTAEAFQAVGQATDGDFVPNQSGDAFGPYDPSYVTAQGGLTPAEYMQTPLFAANVAGHAAVGCLSAVAGGGQCGPAAFSGAAGAVAGPVVINQGAVLGFVAATAVGGTASIVGGGKFANGAKTAAFGYLYNEMGQLIQAGANTIEAQLAAGYDPFGDKNGITDPLGWLDRLVLNVSAARRGVIGTMSCDADGCYAGAGIGAGYVAFAHDPAVTFYSFGRPVHGLVTSFDATVSGFGAGVSVNATCSVVQVACAGSITGGVGTGASIGLTGGYGAP